MTNNPPNGHANVEVQLVVGMQSQRDPPGLRG